MITSTLVAALVLQAKPKPTEAASVKKFVQQFYDWYTPKANSGADAELVTLKTKAAWFTPELRGALLADWKASSENANEIVGLDFDPFLASQDPYTRYVTGKVGHVGQSWLVAVHGVLDGKKIAEPSVTAKLEKSKGKWRFTNFLYDSGSNLLSVLRQLKRDREKKS